MIAAASKQLFTALNALRETAGTIYSDREKRWRPIGSVYYQRAAISGLMVRQHRLFLYFLRGPMFWDMLLGPVLLRMMIENIITLEWICADLDRRCVMYMNYGLGQARLYGENLRKVVEEDGEDSVVSTLAAAQFNWIESQRMLQFVDINLGNWSDTDLRAMAAEVGLEDLYKFGFTVFSAAVHGTWYHTGIMDVRPCQNPLHKFHLIGNEEATYVSEDFLFRACKYFDLFFECVDRQLASKRRRRSLRRLFARKEREIVTAVRTIFGTDG